MSDWLNKAKEAALTAANSAKDAAKNANFGEMLDKTKALAAQAAEEAKHAANAVMSKDKGVAAANTEVEREEAKVQDLSAGGAMDLEACKNKLAQIEASVAELKDAMRKLGA